MKHTAKRILCLILTLIMCFSLLPIWSVDAAALTYQEAMRGLPDGSLAQRVLTRAEYTLDLGSWSTSLPLGAGHLQGILVPAVGDDADEQVDQQQCRTDDGDAGRRDGPVAADDGLADLVGVDHQIDAVGDEHVEESYQNGAGFAAGEAFTGILLQIQSIHRKLCLSV